MSDELRYPIGVFEQDSHVTADKRRGWIDVLAKAPGRLRAAVNGLSPQQIDTPYRPDGWTVRQVVHHLPDSHLNTYTWIRMALTEEEPTIKMYDEKRWAELDDARTGQLEMSLTLFESLHSRWVLLLSSFSTTDFGRSFRDPQVGIVSIDACLDYYAWHSRHHVAHITSLRERMGWI